MNESKETADQIKTFLSFYSLRDSIRTQVGQKQLFSSRQNDFQLFDLNYFKIRSSIEGQQNAANIEPYCSSNVCFLTEFQRVLSNVNLLKRHNEKQKFFLALSFSCYNKSQ